MPRRKAHWFFQRSDGQWAAYSDEDSDALERALVGRQPEWALPGGEYTVLVQDRVQVRTDNNTRRPVLRGTWHYARSDGRTQPYPEDVAEALEAAFAPVLAAGAGNPALDEQVGLMVDVGAERRVVYIGAGSFVQQRGDQPHGRAVLRGYSEENPASSSEDLAIALPAEALRRPANPIRDMAQGYVDGYAEGAGAARNMASWMDAQQPNVALPLRSRAGEEPTGSGEAGCKSELEMLQAHAGALLADDLGSLTTPASLLPMYGKGRWYWARNEGSLQKIPAEESEALEMACLRGVQLLRMELDFRSMCCLVQARKVVDTGRDRAFLLLRASWFFQRSNGGLEPYDEAQALRLECAFFPEGRGAERVDGRGVRSTHAGVEGEAMSWYTKHNTTVDLGQNRVVSARRGGGFCQVRTDCRTARLVVRGYRDTLHPHEQTPHEPFCGWESWVGGGAADSGDGAQAQMVTAGYRRQLGQARLDQMSWAGLQTLQGAAVDGQTQGTEGRSYLLKRETDVQLEVMRHARESTSESLRMAQLETAGKMAAAKIGIEVMAQETIDRFAAMGEQLPPSLSVVGKPTMQLVGQVVGFTSVIGSWIVGGTSTAVDTALGVTDKVVDASIRTGESALSGVQTVMSAAQTEFVLGVEGAAIMENMINIHEAEFRMEYSDIGYMQLARGISAYSALQQMSRPAYIHAGVVDKCGPGLEGDPREMTASKEVVALWLRYMRLSACAYGAQFMTVTGVLDPKHLLFGSERALYERTGIPADKIIHAVWESQGYAQPAWILVQDDQTHAVCLVISGSKSNSDWLSNLRCANVEIGREHYGNLPIEGLESGRMASVHAGIWAAAVNMDGRCLEIVKKAMNERPGWPLVMCGHSLGAGTSSLLAMRWRGMGLFPGLKVYAFGTPPTIDCSAIVKDSLEYITSFQCSDDFVTRWCLGTTLDIAKAGHALAVEEGVVDQLIDISLYGFPDGTGGRDTQGRSAFRQAAGAEADYATKVRRNNKILFDALLKQQKEEGRLPAYALDPAKPYVLPINMAEVPDKSWADGVLRACEERMDADKLMPMGTCHWLVPILQDPQTFRSRRASWAEIADGGSKCKVTLLQPENAMFTRMPVNDHVVSDHCPAPYERCLEALLMQAGGSVPDPEGWVALFQSRQRTGLGPREWAESAA